MSTALMPGERAELEATLSRALLVLALKRRLWDDAEFTLFALNVISIAESLKCARLALETGGDEAKLDALAARFYAVQAALESCGVINK